AARGGRGPARGDAGGVQATAAADPDDLAGVHHGGDAAGGGDGGGGGDAPAAGHDGVRRHDRRDAAGHLRDAGVLLRGEPGGGVAAVGGDGPGPGARDRAEGVRGVPPVEAGPADAPRSAEEAGAGGDHLAGGGARPPQRQPRQRASTRSRARRRRATGGAVV